MVEDANQPAAEAVPQPGTGSGAGKTGGFWRENWIWIVAPLVLILVAVVVLLLTSAADGEDAAFIYNLW